MTSFRKKSTEKHAIETKQIVLEALMTMHMCDTPNTGVLDAQTNNAVDATVTHKQRYMLTHKHLCLHTHMSQTQSHRQAHAQQGGTHTHTHTHLRRAAATHATACGRRNGDATLASRRHSARRRRDGRSGAA